MQKATVQAPVNCDILDDNKRLSVKKSLMFMWENKNNDDVVDDVVEIIW